MDNIVIYKTEDNQVELEIKLRKETTWLTQLQMAELFSKDIRTINEHIQNVYTENELPKHSTIRNFRIVRKEGGRKIFRNIIHYNLDVVISVGYRVRSHRGTQFRIWATNVLRDYLVQGYVINQKRLQSDAEKYRQLNEQIKTLRKVIDNETFSLEQSKKLDK